MPADDKTRMESIPGQVQSPDVLADKGRGDMVSENLAANERFERNSTALQQQQQAQEQAQQQSAQRALTFDPDRQHGPNRALLKIEQAKLNTPERGQDPGAKDQAADRKPLSFGADRQRNRDFSGLKAEQAKTSVKGRDQQQSEKKELSFGPDRGHGQSQGKGQGRAPGLDHGR